MSMRLGSERGALGGTLIRKRPRSMRAVALSTPKYVLAVILAVLAAFPFIFMVMAAFKTPGEFLANPFLPPIQPTVENFTGLVNPRFGQYFLNSVIVSAVSVVAAILVGALAAYPLARLRFPFKGPTTVLFIVGLMIPIHITLLPLYVLTQDLGLYDSLPALFGPYIAFSLPITIYVLIGFFRQIPEDIFSAAKIDGAGHLRQFFSLVVPLAGPAISTVAIINFLFVWNDFVFGLVLIGSPQWFPLPLGLQEFSTQFRVNVPGVMAALTVASIPTIALFLAMQERVVSGLASGAVAGE